MCRMMAFSGTCTRCQGWFEWHDLYQQLFCLEAKNSGAFGECRRGIDVEQHEFNQECDRCTEEANADEGVAGMGEENDEANGDEGDWRYRYKGGDFDGDFYNPDPADQTDDAAAEGSGEAGGAEAKAGARRGDSDSREDDGRRKKRQRTS